jgi:glycosyltransferase involved in cell wall biosynthesis
MRVAIIIPRIAQLGPVKVIQALVNLLCEFEELQIRIFCLDKTVDPQVNMMVPVERLIYRSFCFSDYDIIHTNGIRPDLFAFINRRKIKYHISTIHNFVFDDLSSTYNKLISWIFGNLWLILWKRADKLVCVSHAMKNYYGKWFSSSKLEVIYNGIAEPDNSFVPDYDVIKTIDSLRSKGLKIIGCAGILIKRKGIDQILNLIVEEKEFALVIIGDGKEFFFLQRLAKKLEITDRCLFCGFRSNAVNYFRYFDYFLMPSRSEGFGLALAEAVQQKVPVVCSDIEVFKDLFNSDEVTFFKLEDRSSLTAALKMAMETGNRKAALAYTRYLNYYTDRLMVKHYHELYQLCES